MRESSSSHRSVEISRRDARLFAAALTSIFFLLELINILHHGMWRDEMQVWSLSQHSHSLSELLYLKRYEGHPDGWYVLVFLTSRLFPHPVGMQFLNLAIATAATYLVSRYSPFTRYQKVLIVFGYFLFYEYSAISRDYEIGILALFAFCAAFRPGPKKNYALLAILLSLMAQANIYALILSLCLALMIVVEALQSQNPQEFLFPTAMRIVGSTTLFVLALSASLFEMRIPSDAGWDTTSYMVSHAHTNYLRSTEMIWKAFVPIPRMSTLNFWNTNLLDNYHGLMTVFSLVLLCVSVSLFIRNRTVLFLYLSGLGSLLVFKQLFYFGTLRHDGQAFILFLASAWLLGTYTGGLFPSTVDNRTGLRGPLYRNVVFTGLLAIQAFLGLLVSSMALQLPFSQARATADFIRAKHMDQMLIVGDPDYAVSPIAGFLGREIYYRRGNRMGSYVIWDKARPVSPEESMFEVARHLATDQHQNVLLILTQIPNHSVQEIASFTGSIVRDERYYLYVVKPAPI